MEQYDDMLNKFVVDFIEKFRKAYLDLHIDLELENKTRLPHHKEIIQKLITDCDLIILSVSPDCVTSPDLPEEVHKLALVGYKLHQLMTLIEDYSK